MKSYIGVFIVGVFFTGQLHSVDCTNQTTTYEMDICSSKELEVANKKLELYLSTAIQRYASERKVVEALNESQSTWLVFRKLYCNAVYEIWSDGSIRNVMFSGCMLKLTKQRTHIIWDDFLTYMDTTPPLLPEPL